MKILSGSNPTKESREKMKENERILKNPFIRCPEEIKLDILRLAATDYVFKLGYPDPLKLVCADWNSKITKELVHSGILIAYELSEYKGVWERFLNGKLLYTPDGESDEEIIEMKISDFWNPLEGMFDLSRCGDAEYSLRISTGYWKRKNPENADKVEIWLTPRFLVEKESNESASHLKDVFPSKWAEVAPVGVFWMWGEWDDFDSVDYLTTQNMNDLGSGNFYEKWQECYQVGWFMERGGICGSMSLHGHREFSCLFSD